MRVPILLFSCNVAILNHDSMPLYSGHPCGGCFTGRLWYASVRLLFRNGFRTLFRCLLYLHQKEWLLWNRHDAPYRWDCPNQCLRYKVHLLCHIRRLRYRYHVSRYCWGSRSWQTVRIPYRYLLRYGDHSIRWAQCL